MLRVTSREEADTGELVEMFTLVVRVVVVTGNNVVGGVL